MMGSMGKLLGLTGGIASGKSTVSEMFRECGFPIIDADLIAREVIKPLSAGWKEIVATFGKSILNTDQSIHRKRLAQIIFNDVDLRRQLEKITHPKILELVRQKAADFFNQGYPIVIFDAPLIVETGIHEKLDGLIVVEATKQQQTDRLVKKRGFDRQRAEVVISHQLGLEEKLKHATYVIDNTGSLEQTRIQVK